MSPEQRKNVILRKLALYFNKDEGDFKELVDQNPELDFKGLLAVLKEKGTY